MEHDVGEVLRPGRCDPLGPRQDSPVGLDPGAVFEVGAETARDLEAAVVDGVECVAAVVVERDTGRFDLHVFGTALAGVDPDDRPGDRPAVGVLGPAGEGDGVFGADNERDRPVVGPGRCGRGGHEGTTLGRKLQLRPGIETDDPEDALPIRH